MLIAGSEALVFDPSANIQFYQDFAKERGATISKTFETHRQADYIAGSILLQKEIGAEVMVMTPDFIGADFPFTTLENGQTISLAHGPDIKVIHTPGHTLGSASYFIDGKYLLTGDTIFIQSAGRPDLGGKSEEWSRILYLTLMVTLRDIDDEVLILPGHFTSWQEASDDLLFAAPWESSRKAMSPFILSMRAGLPNLSAKICGRNPRSTRKYAASMPAGSASIASNVTSWISARTSAAPAITGQWASAPRPSARRAEASHPCCFFKNCIDPFLIRNYYYYQLNT